MPAISSVFLMLATLLAVVIGTQTWAWSWGPGLLALGVAVAAALPTFWRKSRDQSDVGIILFGWLTAGWFAWRCLTSPVAEFGQSDLMLLSATVGAFITARAAAGGNSARAIFYWGTAALLAASLWVIFRQIQDPSFVPVFGGRQGEWPSGFASHYNEAANYLIAASLFLLAAAVLSSHTGWARMVWAILAVAGFAAIWFTRSRGGIFGAAVGLGIFWVLAMIVAKRRNRKWFAPALVAVPVIGITLTVFWLQGWQQAQQIRHQDATGNLISGLLDNDCRLYFLGLAMSGISSHPLWGGGSQSFSWECYRFWDPSELGSGSSLPVFTHNELVQAANDYGLVGAGLLVGLMSGVALIAVLSILLEPVSKENDGIDAMRVGGLAVLSGMLVQSSFSFVFHHLPGCLFLGVALGHLSLRGISTGWIRRTASRTILSLAALAVLLIVLPLGWKASRTTIALWPSLYSKIPLTSAEARIDSVTEALDSWPDSPSLLKTRGLWFQSALGTPAEKELVDPAQSALKDFEAALRLHPYDPGIAINRANLLSFLKRDDEAGRAYQLAIQLQGGFEAGFRAHYFFSRHLLQKGMAEFRQDAPAPAVVLFDSAVSQIEEAAKLTPGYILGLEGRDLRIRIHEALGIAQEAAGQAEAALRTYETAAALPAGNRLHYRAALLVADKANRQWLSRQASEAMAGFIDAKNRIQKAGGSLPDGVTQEKRAEFLNHLERSLQYLRIARVQPATEK